MLFLDMTGKLCKMSAVKMYEPAAAETLQVKMTAALLLVLDILIAGACLSVKGILAYKPLLHKSVQLPVNSRNAHRSSLRGEKSAYLLHIRVLFLIFALCYIPNPFSFPPPSARDDLPSLIVEPDSEDCVLSVVLSVSEM